ncbi:hypothetical protein BCR35DRAFT_354633 [Leucosporidium creatinivorum]|uniref:Uncharacterized protein n=1 Tax=Leucosporidium creatinivorum TaxID=106004 RepID=A0A1Y2ED90_9BASI|nr:hypothetical protein BCR35DRAFT_354633 [Leucosporidium creatinivorum]
MAPYINHEGKIIQSPPLWQQAYSYLYTLYLAISLFLYTLFNPAAPHKMQPANSLRQAKRRDDESRRGGGPRGGGGGRGKGGSATLSDFNGPVVNSFQSGGCGGGKCG